MIDIKKAINESGISIIELADRLGVTRQAIHYYINQGGKNSVDTLMKIAEALNIKVKDLIYEQEEQDVNEDNVIVCPSCKARFRAID